VSIYIIFELARLWNVGNNAAGASVFAKDELDFGVRPEARMASQLAPIHRRNRSSLHHK
jgi:hypothetical protein